MNLVSHRGLVSLALGSLLALSPALALRGAAGSDSPGRADVVAVSASGKPGSYTFSVTVRSPDRGCEQYADWWEVLSPGGRLLYRRVLLHSHTDEQPFTRRGGPVPVQRDEPVIVRAHLNTTGYGGIAFRGSVATGFTAAEVAGDFAAGVEDEGLQPPRCAF
ncbi:MAG: hypothetical protein ACE5FK_08855 [Candidatus Methylomirabilia bacterium]